MLRGFPTDYGLDVLTTELRNRVRKYALIGLNVPKDTGLMDLIEFLEVEGGETRAIEPYKFYEKAIDTLFYDDEGFLTAEVDLRAVDSENYMYAIALLDDSPNIVSITQTPQVILSNGIGGLVTLKLAIKAHKDYKGDVIFKSTDYTSKEQFQALSAGFKDRFAELAAGFEAQQSDTHTKFNEQKESVQNQFNEQKESVQNQFNEQKESVQNQFNEQKESVQNQFDTQKADVQNQFNEQKESVQNQFDTQKAEVDERFNNLQTNLANEINQDSRRLLEPWLADKRHQIQQDGEALAAQHAANTSQAQALYTDFQNRLDSLAATEIQLIKQDIRLLKLSQRTYASNAVRSTFTANGVYIVPQGANWVHVFVQGGTGNNLPSHFGNLLSAAGGTQGSQQRGLTASGVFQINQGTHINIVVGAGGSVQISAAMRNNT